jgi:hypothetical protein
MASRKAMDRTWANAALRQAETLGLLSSSSLMEISEHVPRQLVKAAKERAGVRSNKKLLLIALSVLASRDDFAQRFLRRKGTIDPSLDLEF